MRIEKVGVMGLALLALSAVRCSTGTETDNPVGPVRSFKATGCHSFPKDEGPPPIPNSGGASGVGSQSQSLEGPAALDPEARYNNLTCVAWSRTDGELLFRLRNLEGDCGLEFDGGAARIEGNVVTLEGHNPKCTRSACLKTCLYDLEWIVTDVPESGDLDVSFVETDENAKDCPFKSGIERSFTVPESEPEGARCNLAGILSGSTVPAACSLHSDCSSPSCSCGGGARCVEGLVSAAPLTRLCIAECTTDEDCPIPGAFSCTDGLCLTKPW